MGDEDAIVASGGATTSQGMKLHASAECPCLGNAVETREATASERRSREWCQQCTTEVTQEPSFAAYNALREAANDD